MVWYASFMKVCTLYEHYYYEDKYSATYIIPAD